MQPHRPGRSGPAAVLALVVLSLPSSLLAGAAAEAADSPPATRAIAQDSVFVMEVHRAAEIIDLLLSRGVADSVTSLPGYRELMAKPGSQQLLGFIQIVEAQLGTDWKSAIRKLAGGGIVLAARPDGSTLLVADSLDGQLLRRLHEFFVGIARSEAMKEGRPDPVSSREHGGTTIWTLGPEEAHAIVGSRLLLSNRLQGLEAGLDLLSSSEKPSVTALPAFEAARAAAGSAALARLFVNMGTLKAFPPVAQALRQNSEPLGALLFAGIQEALQDSTWLALGLEVAGSTVTLRARTDARTGGEASLVRFAAPPGPDAGVLPDLSVPRRVAAMSLYRDLHGFYAAKDTLFPERTSGLIFFENMMGIFFSGLDLTDEVFGETLPEIRVVAAEQEYDPAVGTPAVQLPGFAAVLRLRNPKQFGEVMEEAWQKALGLVNFTRGQQALPGLIIDRRTHGSTKYTVAYFRAPKTGVKSDLEIRYNVRPTLAQVGDCLILSSTEGLTVDLIDAIEKEGTGTVKQLPGLHSILEVDGPPLASILRKNREGMVRNNMVEKGNSREQAEAEISLLLDVMGFFEGADLTLGSTGGRPEAALRVELRRPGEDRARSVREEPERAARVAGGSEEGNHDR